MKISIVLSTCIFILSSCHYSEKNALHVAENFLIAYQFEDNKQALELYPKFSSFKRFTKIDDYKVIDTREVNKNYFKVFANASPLGYGKKGKNIILFIGEIEEELKIIDSKGLIAPFDNKPYEICEKLGCINTKMSDLEISKKIRNSECSEVESKANTFINISFNKDDIEVLDVDYNFSSFKGTKYFEVKLKNNSKINFKKGDIVFNIALYQNDIFLKSHPLSMNKNEFNSGDIIKISTNYNNDYFLPPAEANKYSLLKSINKYNIVSIYLNNHYINCN
ncbi:MAG: hypothetical protein WD048_00755 [Chitinophagales bacterium]